MVRLIDRPDMTLDVYRGRKTTIQQFSPLDVLDEIWDLIESVSEGFLMYSFYLLLIKKKTLVLRSGLSYNHGLNLQICRFYM